MTNWTHHYEVTLSANKEWSYRDAPCPGAIDTRQVCRRFELQPGDTNATDGARHPPYERSEIAQSNDYELEGHDRWYGWSFFVPEDWCDTGDVDGTLRQVNLAQFHQHPADGRPDNWHPAWMFGKRFQGPFRVVRFPMDSARRAVFTLIDDAVFRGRWHVVKVHARWTTKGDGIFEVWIDDVLKLSVPGPTRTEGNDYVYHKCGLYRPADSANEVTSVAFFRDLWRSSNPP